MEEQSELEELEAGTGALAANKRTRSLIKSSITVHDQTQVETIFDYSIRHADPTKKNGLPHVYRTQSFEVEAYIFLPQQVGISGNDYLRSQFYSDLRPLLRLREPRYSYKEFLGYSKKKRRSPLQTMRAHCRALVEGKAFSASELAEAINEVRVFAASFSSYFIKRINRRAEHLQQLSRVKEGERGDDFMQRVQLTVEDCEPHLRRAYHLRQQWREAINALSAIESTDPAVQALREEMALADEYCHYRYCGGLARLVHEVDALLAAELPLVPLITLSRRLRGWVRLHRIIARQCSFHWIAAEDDIATKEAYLFRKSLLKKRMWQVFYLSIKHRSSLAVQQQVGYMVAAGFAAAWAFTANILLYQQLRERHLPSMNEWQSLVNYSGLLIVLGFVAAYMLKDRIKEWGRAKFRRGVFGNLPDLSEKIWASSLNGRSYCIGVMQESVDFLSAEKLPRDIQAMRAKLPPIDMTGNEKIIRYRKTISLAVNAFDKLHHEINVVRDIVRFNVSRFLSKLDDPLQATFCFRRDGGVDDILVPKVYHLDMLLRYSSKNYGERMQEITVNYNRLAFNKDGLIRIEEQEEEAFSRKKRLMRGIYFP